MELAKFFKSVLDQDTSPVVLCDLDHKIIYMNKSADEHYSKYGGHSLVGKNLLNSHTPQAKDKIVRTLEWFAKSKSHNIIYEFRNDEENKDVYTVALRDDDGELIGYYEKHVYRDKETAKLFDYSD